MYTLVILLKRVLLLRLMIILANWFVGLRVLQCAQTATFFGWDLADGPKSPPHPNSNLDGF